MPILKINPLHIFLAAFVSLMLLFVIMRGRSPENNDAKKEKSIALQKSLTPVTSNKRKNYRKQKGIPERKNDGSDFDPEMKRLMDGLGVRVPSRDELTNYITNSNDDTEAMVAAGIILNDPSYFVRVLEKDPNDPHALYCLALDDSTEVEMKIKLAKKLLEEQPDNAIASYLLAALQAESGNPDESIKTLFGSFDQTEFDDFYYQTSLKVEDAMRGTGNRKTGSALYSLWNVPMPILSKINTASKTVAARVSESSPKEAKELRALTASIGTRMANEKGPIITELVGLATQMMALEGMEDDDDSPFEGLSVNEARKSLEQRKKLIRNLSFLDPDELTAIDPALIESYTNRVRTVGEYEATRWLNQRSNR